MYGNLAKEESGRVPEYVQLHTLSEVWRLLQLSADVQKVSYLPDGQIEVRCNLYCIHVADRQ